MMADLEVATLEVVLHSAVVAAVASALPKVETVVTLAAAVALEEAAAHMDTTEEAAHTEAAEKEDSLQDLQEVEAAVDSAAEVPHTVAHTTAAEALPTEDLLTEVVPHTEVDSTAAEDPHSEVAAAAPVDSVTLAVVAQPASLVAPLPQALSELLQAVSVALPAKEDSKDFPPPHLTTELVLLLHLPLLQAMGSVALLQVTKLKDSLVAVSHPLDTTLTTKFLIPFSHLLSYFFYDLTNQTKS